jgi:hypothetical protein
MAAARSLPNAFFAKIYSAALLGKIEDNSA